MTSLAKEPTRAARLRALGIGNAMLAVAAPGAAWAQNLDAGIDVRLSGEVVSNPYLDQGDAEPTAAVNAEVRPWLRQQTEVTSFNLSAFAQARQFADGQDMEDNYGVSASLSHRASQRVTLTARADVQSAASRLNAVFPGLDPNPATPVPEPLPLDPGLGVDPTLLGTRGRTTTVNGGIGTQYAIDERRSLQIDLDLEDLDFTHANAQDYRTHGVATTLMQVVNATTSVGAALNFRQTDYDSPTVPDARIFLAMGSVSHRLDERWTLEASAGASMTRLEAVGAFARRESTSIAATASLCRREERGSLCVDYERQPQPTGLGQVRNTDTASLSYNREWSVRNRLSVGASYSRSGSAVNVSTPVSETEYLTVRATLERAFNERVSGFVTASTSRVFGSNLAIEPDIDVGLGLHIRLGRQT